jgi:peptidoglycan/LPS O-acetylase OafA/YrhL
VNGAEHFHASLRTGLEKPHLPALDGMRAVAVFIVIFYHAGWPVPGGVGVLMFFVLSGLLITWLLLDEAETWGTVSLRDFYIRRCLRIFPAFYTYAVLCLVVLVVFGKRINVPQMIAALLYVNNYYQAIYGDPSTAFSHTWSLGIEEQFYLLWPATMVVFSRDRHRLAKGLAVAIVVVWVHRLALVLFFHVDQGYIYEAFDTRADSLLIGCLLAVMLRGGMLASLFNHACASVAWPLLTLALLVASMVAELRMGSSYRDTIGLPLDALLVAVLIPQMISFRDRWVGCWLNWRLMRTLGLLSYSLYLYQQITVEPAQRLAARLGLPEIVVVIAVVVTFAGASYHLVERPALRLKEHFSRRTVRIGCT